MWIRRISASLMTAACVVAAIAMAAALVPGCGPGAVETDKLAQYTPESIAEELVFRYQSLSPESRKSSRSHRRRSIKGAKDEADLPREETAQKKGGSLAATKKRSGPPTIDDLLDDIDAKINLVPSVPRAEVCRQVVEAVSKNDALDAGPKKALVEKLNELAGAP